MNIWIDNRQTVQPIRQEHLHHIADNILTFAQAPANSELSIVLVDDHDIRELNRAYRGIDRSTDVLAFAQQEISDDQLVPLRRADPAFPVLLGDVIVSVETTARQAAEHDHAFEQELSVLLAHGILHLLGYDHITDEDAAVMEDLEQQIVRRGVPEC